MRRISPVVFLLLTPLAFAEDARVEGQYAYFIEGSGGPSGSQVIVTSNLKDFPGDALAPYNVEAVHPDDFVLDLIDLAPAVVVEILREQAASLKKPPQSVEQLLATLLKGGMVRSVAKLRELGVGA